MKCINTEMPEVHGVRLLNLNSVISSIFAYKTWDWGTMITLILKKTHTLPFANTLFNVCELRVKFRK